MTQTATPTKGMRFEHARKIVGDGPDRRPDVCTVTKVRGVLVYYRNESGMLMCTDLAKFAGAVGRVL